jgi:fimbrial chaperone protein
VVYADAIPQMSRVGELSMFRFSSIVAALIGLVFAPVAVEAARVSPMIVELEPLGRSSVARIELTNDGDRDIPYEIRMMLGEISEEGKLSFTPADDNFLIFPTQAIVEANSQQVFRIQYVGEPELAKSEVYYMSIQQVPVAFEGAGSQVQVVVNYNVLVNVVPDGTEPKADVEGIESVVQDEKPGIRLRLSNTGSRYFLAGNADWKITATEEDGTPFILDYKKGEMTKKIGVGVVGPGRTRILFIPTDQPLVQESIRVEVGP